MCVCRGGQRLRNFKFPFNLFGIKPVVVSTSGFMPLKVILNYHILISPCFKSTHLEPLGDVAMKVVAVGNCYIYWVCLFV